METPKTTPAIPSRIYLLGFMAAGKSTIGKKLAQLLKYHFLDLDAAIQVKTRQSIPEIFAEHGESYFRKIEKECLEETFSHQNTVIATGGGTPCFFDNLEQMNQKGITLFLYAAPQIICDRLINEKWQRPLVSNLKNEVQLLDYIESKLIERHIFYDRANIKIACNSDNTLSIAEEIVATLKKNINVQ